MQASQLEVRLPIAAVEKSTLWILRFAWLTHKQGYWLNAHIRSLLEERDEALSGNGKAHLSLVNGGTKDPSDVTAAALQASLEQARKMVGAAQKALDTYISIHAARENGVGSRALSGEMGGDTRRGVTSRELSGEMGGDTEVFV